MKGCLPTVTLPATELSRPLTTVTVFSPGLATKA
jgi:hypothetical protein